MRLKPWVLISIGVFSTLLVFGGIALAKDALRYPIKNSTQSIVSIVAVDGHTVVDNRKAFEIAGNECRLRLRMVWNNDPNTRFVVGAIEGDRWEPVSGEIAFGNLPDAEISFPISALPSAGTVPVAIFEKRAGKTSGTIDLIAPNRHPPRPGLLDQPWFTWLGIVGLLFTFIANKSLDSLWDVLRRRKSEKQS